MKSKSPLLPVKSHCSIHTNVLGLIVSGTKQACMFRDQYADLTSTGFTIYGLSNNTPKSNTTFKVKQNLSYTLLCDPDRTLIAAIGLKKSDGKTSRGVFVVDKSGKVLIAASDSPGGTVERVKKLVEDSKVGK